MTERNLNTKYGKEYHGRDHLFVVINVDYDKEFRIKYKIDNESDDLLRELTNKAITELKEKHNNQILITNVHVCTTKYGIELFFGKWFKRNENKLILKGV